MFKKIDIKKFGVFNNYAWDVAVGKNEAFKKLNIIYGRNYSGKTTLSRIFSCVENNCLHTDYPNGDFTLTLTDGKTITPKNLSALDANRQVRVYNTDFIKKNLSWLRNEDGTITPFTVLGETNVELEKKINEIDDQLGNVAEKKGLIYEHTLKLVAYNKAKKDQDTLQDDLESKLKNKAQSIKKNTATFNIPVYTITHLNADIPKATSALSDDKIEESKKLLKEDAKVVISRLPETKPKFSAYISTAQGLLNRKIKPTEPIADLINDSLLQEWVREGIDKHKSKRGTCGFCGNPLSADLWDKLDAHFSKESEQLRTEILALIQTLKIAKQGLDSFLSIERESFYTSLKSDFDDLNKKWILSSKSYSRNIDFLIAELTSREKDIFKEGELKDVPDESDTILAILGEFNSLIDKNNVKTKTLASDQKKIQEVLRLSEVAKFLIDIDYKKQQADISKLATKTTACQRDYQKTTEDITDLLEEKRRLEAQSKDESKGAELVNQHLNHFFGHNDLKLVAEEVAGIMKFHINRDGGIAKNLSEGESSLISFCYFIAKIEDEMKDAVANDGLLIYIDDPISSLDNNHIFFMFSLIESVITKPKKYGQLFISTHNLDFLKYLKKLTGASQQFIVERKSKDSSQLKISPEYLKKYITEFNYLFHQIYLCSTADDATLKHEYQYNFGNNMRKFLEAYLFYKYPNHTLSLDKRLDKFFDGDQVTITLINRVINEYSHLGEHVDRGLEPVDVDAMSKVAKSVISKIQANDPNQYTAFLESIGLN